MTTTTRKRGRTPQQTKQGKDIIQAKMQEQKRIAETRMIQENPASFHSEQAKESGSTFGENTLLPGSGTMTATNPQTPPKANFAQTSDPTGKPTAFPNAATMDSPISQQPSTAVSSTRVLLPSDHEAAIQRIVEAGVNDIDDNFDAEGGTQTVLPTSDFTSLITFANTQIARHVLGFIEDDRYDGLKERLGVVADEVEPLTLFDFAVTDAEKEWLVNSIARALRMGGNGHIDRAAFRDLMNVRLVGEARADGYEEYAGRDYQS